ncbi:hypothetical protein N2152v2_007751 [Parachlorella kessleri]
MGRPAWDPSQQQPRQLSVAHQLSASSLELPWLLNCQAQDSAAGFQAPQPPQPGKGCRAGRCTVVPPLPTELLEYILCQQQPRSPHSGYAPVLAAEDIVRSQLVCKAWQVACRRVPLWLCLGCRGTLPNGGRVTPKRQASPLRGNDAELARWMQQQRPAVKVLELYWGLGRSGAPPDMQQLQLFKNAVLGGLTFLEITADPIAPLLTLPSQLPGLRHLALTTGAVAASPDFGQLGCLATLETLKLSACGEIQLAGPALQLPRLRCLDIEAQRWVVLEVALPRLEVLWVREWPNNPQGLVVRVARPWPAPARGELVLDPAAGQQAPLPQLRKASIAAAHLQLDLAIAPALTKLSLYGLESLAGIEVPAQAQRLASLVFSRHSPSGHGGSRANGSAAFSAELSAFLRKLGTLRQLSLWGVRVTAPLQAALGALPQLAELRRGGVVTPVPCVM